MLARNSDFERFAVSARVFSEAYFSARSTSWRACSCSFRREASRSCTVFSSATLLSVSAASCSLMAVMSVPTFTWPPLLVRRSLICSQRPPGRWISLTAASLSLSPATGQASPIPARAMMSLRAAPSSAAAMFRNSANLLFAVTSRAFRIPEHEGLADALDGVAQPFVRFRHAFFGELLFGDVDGDADEPVACAAAAPHLALRMHPHPASVRVAQPERRVVGTRGTVRRLRDLVDRRRVLGMRHRLDLGGQEPFRRLLQPHHVEHGGRPVDAVLAHVPVPDAAARPQRPCRSDAGSRPAPLPRRSCSRADAPACRQSRDTRRKAGSKRPARAKRHPRHREGR